MLTNYDKALLTRARRLLIDERLSEPEAREQLKIYAARQLAREFDIYDYRRPVELAIERIAAEARRKGIQPKTVAVTPTPLEADEQRSPEPTMAERAEYQALVQKIAEEIVYYSIPTDPAPPAEPDLAVIQAAKAAADAFRRAVDRARHAPPQSRGPSPTPEVRSAAGRFVRNLKSAESAQRRAR